MADELTATTNAQLAPAEVPIVVVPTPTSESWGPVQPEERIALIDVLRGLSLFGIIAANMRGFAGPIQAYFNTDLVWQTRTDFWVQAFVDTFIQGKFITLFAFLFGVGFTLQFARAESRHARFGPVYRRRLEGLILIGFLHQLLFWWGDVLVTYGLGGFLLMAFRKRRSKTILIWTLCLMMLPCLGVTGYVTFRHFWPPSAQRAARNRIQGIVNRQEEQDKVRKTIEVNQKGSYAKIFVARLPELAQEDANQPGVVIYTLPLFLLGMLVFRQGIFQDPASKRELLKKCLILGLAAGIPMNVAATWLQTVVDAQAPGLGPTPAMAAMVVLRLFGRPILSMGYACAIALLFLNESWRRWMLPFGAIGRTALTNYLLQTVIGTTIFFGYGLGLYGRVHLLALFILSVVIYLLQTPLSQWWLSRYRFGPVEWCWRTMTYGKPPEMRRTETAVS